MKKFILGFMILGMVVFGAHKAKASTLEDLANQISILMQQISELKSDLSAAVALTRTTTTVAPVTTTTVPVITETRIVTPTVVAPKPTTGSTDITVDMCVNGGGKIAMASGSNNFHCRGGSYDGAYVEKVAPPVVTPSNARVIAPVINPTNPLPPVNAKTTAPENSTIPTNAKIVFGMRNNAEVRAFQQKLLDLGYLSNSSQVSGNYLGVTKTAIMKFQKDNGLKADGVWGSKTAQSLLNPVNPAPKNETWVCLGGSNDGETASTQNFCNIGCGAGGGSCYKQAS